MFRCLVTESRCQVLSLFRLQTALSPTCTRVNAVGLELLLLPIPPPPNPSSCLYPVQVFKCMDIDGVARLVADMRLPCYTAQWYGVAAYAGLYGLVFVFGLPMYVTRTLFRKRHLLFASSTPASSVPASAGAIMTALGSARMLFSSSTRVLFSSSNRRVLHAAGPDADTSTVRVSVPTSASASGSGLDMPVMSLSANVLSTQATLGFLYLSYGCTAPYWQGVCCCLVLRV
jgi:hypothetical protein